jgi:glycosyltransferase involved in cell wall biosynthesis
LPEVAGPGAISVDPDRPEDVPAILDRLRNDTDFRAEVVAAGRVNAARFSWAESADRLITVLQTAAGPAGPVGSVGTVGSSHPSGSGESAD